jgi:hypothetical protein
MGLEQAIHATKEALFEGCLGLGVELHVPFGLGPSGLPWLQEKKVLEDEGVHLRAHEAAVGVVGCAHDGLAAHVEGGVDDEAVAGALLEGGDHLVVLRVVGSVDGLHTRGVVHVGDGGHVTALAAHHRREVLARLALRGREAPPRLHGGDQKHVWALALHLEELRDVLLQDGRGEGPEGLPILDLQVQVRLHLRTTRVAQDRAAPQRTRTELEPIGEVADHLALSQERRDPLGPSPRLEPLEGIAVGLQEGLDLVRRVARAEIRRGLQRPAVLAKHPRSSEVGVVDVERRPQRASGVSRRGLDPDALEGSLAQDATVGPSESGKCISLRRRSRVPSPTPMDAVAHSPTPSMVRMAASSKGEG